MKKDLSKYNFIRRLWFIKRPHKYEMVSCSGEYFLGLWKISKARQYDRVMWDLCTVGQPE
jgi:hypothetical protein